MSVANARVIQLLHVKVSPGLMVSEPGNVQVGAIQAPPNGGSVQEVSSERMVSRAYTLPPEPKARKEMPTITPTNQLRPMPIEIILYINHLKIEGKICQSETDSLEFFFLIKEYPRGGYDMQLG